VAKVQDETAKTWTYTCTAGQALSSRKCASGTCTEVLSGTCPTVK